MMYDAKLTWVLASDSADALPCFTTVKVSAPDEFIAKKIIESEFPKSLRGFREQPEVIFKKIEISPAPSNLVLISGYGV